MTSSLLWRNIPLACASSRRQLLSKCCADSATVREMARLTPLRRAPHANCDLRAYSDCNARRSEPGGGECIRVVGRRIDIHRGLRHRQSAHAVRVPAQDRARAARALQLHELVEVWAWKQ